MKLTAPIARLPFFADAAVAILRRVKAREARGFAVSSGGSSCRFDDEATSLVGIERDGDYLRAAGHDPQIHLQPLAPVAAGWCQVVLRLEGPVKNPRVYFDTGAGFSEAGVALLEWSDSQSDHGYRAMVWLPGPALALRLDPSDVPCRFRIHALMVDPVAPRQLAKVLCRPEFASPVQQPSLGSRLSMAVERVVGRGELAQLRGDEASSCVFFSEFSHLSGVSLLMDDVPVGDAVISVDLFGFAGGTLRKLRSVEADGASADLRDWQHFYWDPVEDSAKMFFLARLRLVRDGKPVARRAAKPIRVAKPINSRPEPFTDLPQAVLFSPVTQCNLNCTHCISAFTRTKMQVASERVWEEIENITRQRQFLNLATDYSGDILFDEVRHGGLLSRIIAMDAPFRIDTNANCLDEPIVDKLLDSRLFEINFSIDSMDADVYREVRRGSIPLAEVLAKIGRFMERKRASGKKINTIISFVLMRSNAATIKPAIRFARDHGIDNVSVIQLNAFTEAMVEEIFIWDSPAYAALYAELSNEAAALGVSLNMQAPVRTWSERDGHAPCEVPWGTAVVLGNGDVMACCVPGTRLGNLNEKTLHELWHGPEYRDFRTRVNSPNPPEPCRNCSMIRIPNNRKSYAPVLYTPQPSAKRAAKGEAAIRLVDRRDRGEAE